MTFPTEKICPRCDSAKMKSWQELSGEERFLAERLPGSAVYTREERKKHRFCIRCWFEEESARTTLA